MSSGERLHSRMLTGCHILRDIYGRFELKLVRDTRSFALWNLRQLARKGFRQFSDPSISGLMGIAYEDHKD